VDSQLEQRLYEYFEPMLVLCGYSIDQIIFGYQNGAQPLDDFAVINITDIVEDMPNEVRYDYIDNPEKTINEDVYYRNVVTISLELNGAEVFARARKAKSLMYSSEQTEAAQRLKLGFVGYTKTVNLSLIQQQSFLNRVSFSVTFNSIDVERIDLATIGQVTVIGHDDSGRLMMDKTFIEPTE